MNQRNLEYDINFFFNYPRLELLIYSHLGGEFEYIKSNVLKFAQKNKKFYIFTPHEKIISKKVLNNLLELIGELNNSGFYEIYLCMTTTTKNNLFLNPLCSVLHYTGDYSKDKDQVGVHTNNLKIKILDLNNYNYQDKVYRGIFSIRKTTYFRDLFYQKFDKKFDGIFRYSRMDRGTNTGIDKPSSFTDLIKDFNKSFFSFIFETDTDNILNSFTEKSMIAFLSKTMPILFLTNENQLNEFKNIGLTFFNHLLDYNDVKENDSDIRKVDAFINAISKFNNLTTEEIKGLYKNNLSTINKNYEIISSLLKKEMEYTQEKLIIDKQIF